jgi:N-acetyl-anhydromuramyl-L-alanine amidase AmpD
MNLRLPVDGIMGPETRSAIRSFQGRWGLPVTGLVSPETEKALAAAEPGRASSKAQEFDSDQQELELEDKSDRNSRNYIQRMQSSLNKALGLRMVVDGIMGPQTRSAIRSFQQRQGLRPDGLLGPLTERALFAVGAGLPLNRVTLSDSPGRPPWIQWTPSPYHSSRMGHPVTAIIYHFTAGPSLSGTVRWFQNNPLKVSSHYVIGKDGSIVQMIPLERAAHHAGVSSLPGCRGGVNRCSIGIEIVNWGLLLKHENAFYTHNGKRYSGPEPVLARGRYWEPFTDNQFKSLIRLTKYLLSSYPSITHITGHEDIAPGRKNDPGGAFNWQIIRASLGSAFGGHMGPLNTR